MFSFVRNIYLFDVPEYVYDIMSSMTPAFIFLNRVDVIDKKWIKEADFVFVNSSADVISDILEIMKANGKTAKQMVGIINNDDFEYVDDDVIDIWPNNITEKQLRYFYKRFIQYVKIKKDYLDKCEILDTIMDSTNDLIWVKDINGAHKMFNNSFLNALPNASDGHKKNREECIDRGHLFLWELDKEEYIDGEYICMESEIEVINSNKTLVLDETLMVGSGELRNLVTRKSPLHDENGNIIGTLGFAKDVTTELQYKKMLEHQAYVDHLTNLFNRRHIYEYINTIHDKDFVLVYIDLDNFKSINDEYGHIDGDNALILTAKMLEQHFKDCVIGRIGGDEFVVIYTNITPTIQKLIETFPSVAKETYDIHPKFKKLGVSMGYAVSNPDNFNIEKLFALADKRMYTNKEINKAKNKK